MKLSQQDVDHLMDADLSMVGKNKARDYFTLEDLIENIYNLWITKTKLS